MSEPPPTASPVAADTVTQPILTTPWIRTAPGRPEREPLLLNEPFVASRDTGLDGIESLSFQRRVVEAELRSGLPHLRRRLKDMGAVLAASDAPLRRHRLKDETIGPRERLIRCFHEFANEYPWQWTPAHLDSGRPP